MKGEKYLGYEGYGIYKGFKNVKIEKLRQRKTATQFEHQKLATAREDIDLLTNFINHTE